MKPQDPPVPGPALFSHFVDQAFVVRGELSRTAAYALQTGVNPRDLIHYVQGVCTDPERREVEHLLAQSPWALSRVVALVKAKRNPASLGAQVLKADSTNPYGWGIKQTGDPDMDIALLLESIG